MATTARVRNRTVAPKATTKTEDSVKPTPAKASFWTRVATKARRVVSIVTKSVRTFATRVRTVTAKAVAVVKPVVVRAWTRALRPFLKGVMAGIAAFVFIVSAIVAPVTTVLLVLGLGLFFLVAAWGVKQLELREFSSRAASIALRVLDGIAKVFVAIAYAASFIMAVSMALASWPFAVFSIVLLTLSYFDMRGAGTISFLLWSLLSGNWALGLTWLLWRGALRVAAPRPASDVPEYSEMRREPLIHADTLRRTRDVPRGAEEMTAYPQAEDAVIIEEYRAETAVESDWVDVWEGNDACAACGTTEGALRVRSNALPFVTVAGGENAGMPHAQASDMLCSDCYSAECEDNVVAMTGVSLRKRSVDVMLNALGRKTLPEVAASEKDASTLHWAVVGWWRDRRGNHHERQWDCYHAGKVVATVVYDHPRKVYRASAFGRLIGTKTALSVAKRLASDIVSDEGLATLRMVNALDDVSKASP